MCLPNFLEKRVESVLSSLEAKLVDEADFRKTSKGRRRGESIRRRHTLCWRRERSGRSSFRVLKLKPADDAQMSNGSWESEIQPYRSRCRRCWSWADAYRRREENLLCFGRALSGRYKSLSRSEVTAVVATARSGGATGLRAAVVPAD
jgi:hypothetical protein